LWTCRRARKEPPGRARGPGLATRRASRFDRLAPTVRSHAAAPGQHVLSAAPIGCSAHARWDSTWARAHPRSISHANDGARARRSEDEANRVVGEDRPVTIRFAKRRRGLAPAPQKESGRTGTLRLVNVEGFDLSGLRRHTSPVHRRDSVSWRSWPGNASKAGQRLEFYCGRRALGGSGRCETPRRRAPVAGRFSGRVARAVERLQADGKIRDAGCRPSVRTDVGTRPRTGCRGRDDRAWAPRAARDRRGCG